MKNFYFAVLFILFSTSYLNAQPCPIFAGGVVCPGGGINDDFSIHTDEAIYANVGQNDVYYQLTVIQDASATSPPTGLEVTIYNSTSNIFVGLVSSTTCIADGTTVESIILPPTTACSESHKFTISGADDYFIVVEGTGTYDIYFAGMTGSTPQTPCPQGTLQTADISACGGTPFKSANPVFELCLNGSVIPTDNILTYNLAPATNQLCIRTNLENPTGTEGLRLVDFNFGPALTAIPTLNDCNSTTLLTPGNGILAQNGGDGFWIVSGFTNPPSGGGVIPAGINVVNSISWVFNGRDFGDGTSCIYNCHIYEFCFEITATNNDPLDTKIVGVYYPDGTSDGAVQMFGCDNYDPCPSFLPPAGSPPIVIDFDDPAVPVELLSFTGVKVENASLLEWTTASETDNSHFEIEHSKDGKHFNSIGKVNGHGTTIEFNKYGFVHTNPSTGINYYRLKQVDFNGMFDYAGVITLNFKQDKVQAKVYPSPTSTFLNVETNQAMNSVEIVDLTGRVLLEQICEGKQSTRLDVEALPVGTYFVNIKLDETVKLMRFVKD